MSKTKEREYIESLGIEESAGFKNLIAIRDYTKKTRTLLQENDKFVKELKNLVVGQAEEIKALKAQLAQLRISQLSGGPTVIK